MSAETDHTSTEGNATTRLVRVEAGLYAIGIAEFEGTEASGFAGMSLPAVHVSAPPCDDCDPVELPASSAETGNWIGSEGGSVVAKAPPGGGILLLTAYGADIRQILVEIRRLGPPKVAARPEPMLREATPSRKTAVPESPGRELRTEITLHIERIGDQRFAGEGWVGARGQKRRVEAFSIRPLEVLSPSDIEYMAYGPNGRETPWVSEGSLCGSRGRGLPLTGFAIRLAPHLRDRFDAVYEASFFSGGVVGPLRNGEACASPVPDDPLEAIHFRLTERAR